VTGHSVSCGDYGHWQDPEEEWTVEGFPTAELAAEYARRFVRAQIEDLRASGAEGEALRDQYYRWGEYAWADGLDHAEWVAFCIATPATKRAETDYAALDPAGRR
jgi:hypothetical protein